jgi:hypothetical protein
MSAVDLALPFSSLPLPVLAWAMTSRPSSIGGRLCACTGVMLV